MIVTFGKKYNGKPAKVDVLDAIFRTGRTIARPRPKKAGSKPTKPPAHVEAPAPVETPADPVVEVTNVPAEASPSAAEAIAPAAELTCPAPTTEIPAADLDENAATAPAMAPVGQPILEWTPEDDNKLLELRERKIPWREIGALLGGKHGIRDRFKELCRAKSMHASGANQEAKNNRAADDGLLIDLDTRTKPRRASIEGSKSPTMHFEEGDDLTLKEMMCLYKLHDLYERKKWIEISSRFFDKTGKRIDPEKLRAEIGDPVWSVED